MINKLRALITVLGQSRNPFRLIIGLFLMKSGLHNLFTIQLNGYKIKFSKSAIALTLFTDKKERNEDQELLKRILRPGDNYVDVGANIGTFALTAASVVSETGKVIAIEPHPATFANLKKNISMNTFSNITLIHSAAGNKKGSVFFSNINSDDQNKVLQNKKNSIEVSIATLDELLEKEITINLLKIDVEGYEKFVLEGALATLKKTSVVLYESWNNHFSGFGYDTFSVITLLNGQGFKVFKLNDDTLNPLPKGYNSTQ